MNLEESGKPKTMRKKKCPECESENVIYLSGHGVIASERAPDPTRRLYQCQDCQEHFGYAGPFP